ncbi:hypothetical protein OH687_16220 [Burkholderia anthina]|nr:hypothetical protein OH687_16220 [Burkholderia anthina]
MLGPRQRDQRLPDRSAGTAARSSLASGLSMNRIQKIRPTK